VLDVKYLVQVGLILRPVLFGDESFLYRLLVICVWILCFLLNFVRYKQYMPETFVFAFWRVRPCFR